MTQYSGQSKSSRSGIEMKFVQTLLLAGILIFSSASSAQDTELVEVDVIGLITSFSKSSGMKFVLDPRVMAKIKLVGFDVIEMDFETLAKILWVYQFVAIESDGVVYVLPNHDLEETRKFLTN